MFELALDGEKAVLTLNRPEVRNAIPLSGWDALADRAGEAVRAGARLLVVRGAGGTFCAGADLGYFEALRKDEAARARFRLAMSAGLDSLADLPIPTIALIDGACYGAGVALAMACDLRVATSAASFAITPARFGISFPQEDVHRLVLLVGPGNAARLLFTAEAVGADEALRIGLADCAAPPDGSDVVAAILAGDSASLATLKRGIRLAAAGVRSDARQDGEFDRLFGSQALAARLAERGKR